MDLLDKDLTQIIEKLLEESNRKNLASSHYWYPLNYATFGVEEITSSLQSMISFRTSMAEKCKLFENLFKEYIGSEEAIFVNSGSSADLLAMQIMVKSPEYKIKKGDKVLVPAITWPTQIWSIIQAGLVPVLYDCSPVNFNPDIKTVSEDILRDCKMIFTTHILGTCCDIDYLLDISDKYNLLIVEDACESLGTLYKKQQVGTFGEVGTFSTFFSHHITTMEGGMITTNNKDLMLQAKVMRAHGWSRAIQNDDLEYFCSRRNIFFENFESIDSRYLFLDEGYNLRPTEINASFGIHQIKKIENFNKIRKTLSNKFYNSISNLKNIKGPEIVDFCDPCFMALPLTITNKKFNNSKAIKFLEKRGIESRPLIAGNIAMHPAKDLVEMSYSSEEFKGADHHHLYSFYVGLSPIHKPKDIERLLTIIEELDNTIDKI